VAIPALIAYRAYRAKVDGFLVDMEQQAARLVDTLEPRRAPGPAPAGAAAPRR
jgi:biopolymer transport protein ExbB